MRAPFLLAVLAATSLLSACATTAWDEVDNAPRLGMYPDEVRQVMGQPSRIDRGMTGPVWYYDREVTEDETGAVHSKSLTVLFTGGKVTGLGEATSVESTSVTYTPNTNGQPR